MGGDQVMISDIVERPTPKDDGGVTVTPIIVVDRYNCMINY